MLRPNMKKKFAEPLRRPERKRHNRRKPSASTASRMLEFEEKLLQLKLAGPEDRIQQLAQFARMDGLSTSERRQVLMATRKYILARRSELPQDLSGLLVSVIELANKRELRTKALALFRQALEAMPRKDVVRQIVVPLEQLLRGYLPKASKQSFSPELFRRVAQRMENTHDVGALVDVTSLGLFFFPFHGPLRELRADYQFMAGNVEGAQHDFAQLVEQYPERPEYRLDHAEALLHLDDFEGSLSEVRSYLRMSPDEPNALRIEAECLAQTGRGNEAMRIYARLIEREGESPELLLSRAKTLEQMDLYDEAIADAERVLELDRENAEAKHLRQSLILRRQSYGMEDDLYSAFTRGDESVFMGETKIPETTFADVGGLDKPKQLIKETILYPLKYKELSQRYGKKAGGGILLFGPPGCGKTLLARAAAGECGVNFINVNLST
ncbi:MAG TPA: tetratricopeptide repeat protein, partial [Firmicutes bacterium]|nr:tetratricopeptide repeat protein [Bacillota bacterium]